MSSIGAIFEVEGVSPAHCERMRTSLRNVPHDQSEVWKSDRIALAASIQHTNGESREAAQPCISEDGRIAAVFDGYLLNPQEVTADLEAKGAILRDRSDVEIALRAYETWGDGCAAHLEGEFAILIADMRAGRLFAARDHMGFVPLYYRREANRLIVASDMHTIAALAENPMEPNPRYLAQVMTNRWYLREETAWRGVSRIVRAHTLSFDGQRLEQHRYWEPPTDISIRYKRDEEYVEHYRELLHDCVRRASRSDRAIGVAVSGGLDSSALYTIANALEQRGQLQAPGFAGYSLAAEEEGNAFELPYARAVADHIGRPLTEVPLFDPDIDWYTNDAAWHHDLPIPSNGAMMLDMERQVVADGSRVLINGSGGDEWLQGGLHDIREYLRLNGDARAAWQVLKQDGQDFGWPSSLKRTLRFGLAEMAPGSIREPIRKRLRERRRRADLAINWLSPELQTAIREAEEAYEEQLPSDTIEWVKHNLATSPFSDLSHSMMRRQRDAIGIESRHPMLSRPFIEFSLRTPGHIKRKGAVTKLVHRRAMEGVLPPVILERTSKANFTNTKIDAQFADYVREHAPSRLSEICDLAGLKPLIDVDFNSSEGDYWAWEIWGLYASAAFLYQHDCVTEINPATGVQQDRK